jgi:hypothetical protein
MTRNALPTALRYGLQLALPLWAELHPVKAEALANRIEPGWQRRSACAGDPDPDAWFPPEKAPTSPTGSAAAAAACSSPITGPARPSPNTAPTGAP